MPASTANGYKKVAVVIAKLIIDGVSKGSRSFLVPITDGKQMYRGITSYELPPRTGTTPLDFSLTKFDNVHVPRSALLGREDLSIGTRVDWWEEISRIPIGTFGVALPFIQGLKQISFIAGKYSIIRRVGVGKGTAPIISFATQQIPVLQATATSYIMDAWWPDQVQLVRSKSVPFELRHAAATIFKTTVVRHALRLTSLLSERCGAQGTFEQNVMQGFEVGGASFHHTVPDYS
jgi:acyl-CoA oxidase